MMKTTLVLILLLPLSPARAQTTMPTTSAPAASSVGPVTYGAGHKLCSEWIAAETKPDQSDYYADRFWVAGFMSAYNWYVSTNGFDIGRGLTPDDMKTSMHSLCAARPAETIASAASDMLIKLKARQLR